jgi:rubrerythrin
MRMFSSVDEVLDFAIKREVDAQEFYVKLAGFVDSPEMVKVLLELVSEEIEHKSKLESVKTGKEGLDGEKISGLGVSEFVENIEPNARMSYPDLLIAGMKKEEKSQKLYLDLATIAEDARLRDILLQMANEEAGHKIRFEIEYDLIMF